MTEDVPVEEKRHVTWGTDVPEDLVLDEKLLADALKKVCIVSNLLCLVFLVHSFGYLLSYVFSRREGREWDLLNFSL